TALLGFVGLVALTTSVGCGPGLTRHAKTAAQPDVFTVMDAELKNALVGTTTLTSGEPMPLPDSRLPLAQWDGDDQQSAPVVQTWGASQAPPQIEPSPYEPAPAAPAIPAEIPAKRDPLSFP
ncbi:MAG TPA: hypothetical protein VIF62_34050, partial [Labilithrix sp.]